jgi:SRSO17 transposase
MALLAPYANERVGTFEDGSGLSLQLGTLAKKNSTRVFYEKRIESSKANFKQLFKGNNSLNNASFYLNTPLVTSSLIASQLRANDIAPYALLSTQINYNPLLLTLTQSEDRDKMFIANSIQKTPAKLEEINALFGHDIVYDWVNYSTSVGADLLATHFFENKTERVFKESISNNQVVYNTVIVKPAQHSFKPISQ